MAEFTLEALKDEIVVDPLNIGYKNSPVANDWKADQIIADLINAKNFSIIQERIESSILKSVVPSADYLGLAPSEEGYLNWLTATEFVDISSTHTQAALFKGGAEEIWAPTDDAGQNILDVATIPAGRAQVLWGESKSVSAREVGAAFNLLP